MVAETIAECRTPTAATVAAGPPPAMGPGGVDPWAGARCRDGQAGMADLFFSDQLGDIARAKALCAGCPVAVPCLEGAVDRREPAGVWGGQLFADGRILAFKRKRGRPSKAARAQMTA